MKHFLLAAFVCAVSCLAAQQPTISVPQKYTPQQGTVEFLGTIPDLKTLKPYTPNLQESAKTWHQRNYFIANEFNSALK